jgi:hypothetical protein
MNISTDTVADRVGSFILPCDFKIDGGGGNKKLKPKNKTAAASALKKKPAKTKKKPAAATAPKNKPAKTKKKTSTISQFTNSYCYTCNTMSEDVEPLYNEQTLTRESKCCDCNKKRSVYTSEA